ncbi:hypothetical protein F528_0633 [Neisseria meningitidis 992008]|uniref:Uncharacterized protein n=1 Tax=Neisseria meningitidis serogroup B (strain ATCC 13091 / M2091) TaxID=862513 RepID=E0NAR7_NEIM3|nr:hypothetical protein HMPREF0602_1599 [Neisseria meningitidis ATCC 13091]KER40392.1 hypothetical protein F528_0633 [Neisseria meningitidis 992008]
MASKPERKECRMPDKKGAYGCAVFFAPSSALRRGRENIVD